MFTYNHVNSFNKSKKEFNNKISKITSIENQLKLIKENKPTKPEYNILENLNNKLNSQIQLKKGDDISKIEPLNINSINKQDLNNIINSTNFIYSMKNTKGKMLENGNKISQE